MFLAVFSKKNLVKIGRSQYNMDKVKTLEKLAKEMRKTARTKQSEEPPLPKELIEGIEALNNAILVDKNQLAKEKKKTTPQAANLRRKRQLEESSATNVHSASPMKSMLINSKSPLKKKVRFEAEAESSALPKSTPTEINESKAELEADGIAKGKGKKPAAMAKTKIINKSLALETSQRRTNNSLSTELVELPTPSRKSRRLSAAKAPLYKAKDADGSASQSAQSPSLNSELEKPQTSETKLKVNRELNITEFEGFSEEEVKESLSPKDITVEMVKIQPNVTASTSAGSKVDETPMETDIEETSPKKTMSDETFVESTAVRLPVSPPTYISTLYIKLKTPEKSPEALIVVHHSIVINLANTSEFKSEKGEKANDVAIVEQMGEVGVVDESGAIEDGGAVGEPGRMEVNGAIEEVVNNSPSDDELMAVMPMADIDMVAETQPQEWGVQSQKSSEGINLDADMLGLTGSEFWSPVGEIPREHEEIIHPIEQPQDRPLSAYPEELEEVNNVNHSHCSPNKTRSPENFQTTQQTEDDSYLAWMNLSQIPETQQPTTSSSQIENAPQEEQLSPEISFTSAQQTGQPSNQLTKEAKANEPSDLVINCSGLSVEEKLNVMNFALRIREVKFCSGDVDSSTTHLVVKAISTPEGYRCVNRTLKYMKAMARRLWVVSYDWIVKSFEQQKPLSPEEFEVIGDVMVDSAFGGPKLARTSQIQIFRGFHFFILEDLMDMNLSDVVELIEAEGGVVLQSLDELPEGNREKCYIVAHAVALRDKKQYCNHLCEKYRVWPVDREWILTSITMRGLAPLENLVLCDSPERRTFSSRASATPEH